MDYAKEIVIDEQALDIEWLQQSTKMLQVTEHQAKCRYEMDIAAQDLDVVKADLDKDIRTNPGNYDIVKITETVVTNTIITQPEYEEANLILLKARYEHEVAKGAVTAFAQRKDSLENLVRLHGQNYFAGPSIPRNLREEIKAKEERTKQVQAGIAGKLNKPKRTK